ncbi:Levanase precursor [compost metagenome]
MNDPNGMVYYDGEYHLFYQNNPYGTTWGSLHWGHAVSSDLVHWKHLPIAISPDIHGQIFSGSIVIDWGNTAGFGKEAMVALFTHAGDKGQVQSIAYSLDKGRKWNMYEGNPVMPDPPAADWRDPKMFWHEESNQWVMSLVANNKVMFYTSPNLKNWTYASEFGPDGGIQANSLDSTSYAISSQGGGSFNYEGDITLNTKNGREGSGGLVFRSDKRAANGYVVNLDAKNDRVTLTKNRNGESIELAASSLRLDTSSTYHLQIATDRAHIQVFVNNQPVLDQTDDEFAYGYYGLTAWNSTASFRNVKFNNTSNFVTNLSQWTAVNGSWEDTLEGMSGTSAENSYVMSGQTGENFRYQANMKLSDGGDETGSLVFRADAGARNGYMASLDVPNDKIKLLKLEDGKQSVLAEATVSLATYSSYPVEVRTYGGNIKVYLNGKLTQEVNDSTFSSGLFGLQLVNASGIFQDVQLGKNILTDENGILNHDFETGDLTGWTHVQGDAFTNNHVTDQTDWWGGAFNQQGQYHLWGFSERYKGDDATGELRSSYFKLGGSGEINLMMGGGKDVHNRYVSLVRASDDQELLRQANTGSEEETYHKYVWDASSYIGEVLYIKAVDYATGSWGHINLDDVNVYNEGPIPEQVDQVAQEPEKGNPAQSGLITDWSAVSGSWIPSTNGSIGGVWECPALIEVPVDGNPEHKRWVLQISINPGAPAGGSGVQYFVGSFDGKTFTNENSSDKILWSDYGADYYAAVEWNGIEGANGEKYWAGWMSNWAYAESTPTSTWRGSLSLPRTVELTQTEEGLRLKQTPVSLSGIREETKAVSYTNEKINGESGLLSNFSEDTFEMIAEFDLSKTQATEFGFKVRKGNDEYTTVGYDVYKEKLFVDRTNSGGYKFGPDIADKHEGPLKAVNGTVKMHVFVDRSALEVFGNNGETVITNQIFPGPSSNGLQIYSKDGDVELKSLQIFPLKSIWKVPLSLASLRLGWTTISGKWADTIHGKQGQSAGDAFILSSEVGGDFWYEADIKVPDTDSHPDDPEKDTINNPIGAGALVFRSDPAAKNAYAISVDVRNNVVKLIKFVDGTGSELAIYNNDGNLKLRTNQDYHLKVAAVGDTIKAYLDGKLVIDTKDPSYARGYFGLNVWDTTVFFNNIRISSYNSGNSGDNIKKNNKDSNSPVVNQKTATLPVSVLPGRLEYTPDVTQKADGRKEAAVVVDDLAITKAFPEKESSVITLQVQTTGADVVIVELTGMANKLWSERQALNLKVITELGTYTLPAGVVNRDATLSINMSGLRITLAKATMQQNAAVQEAAVKTGATVGTAPVDFKVEAVTGSKASALDFGDAYVSRTLPLSSAVDPNRSTAARYDEAKGKLVFVPSIFRAGADGASVEIKHQLNGVYTVVNSSPAFGDVPAGYWGKADIELLAAKGIVAGSGKGIFGPSRPVTRAEFSAMLVRALGLEERANQVFKDTVKDSWYSGYLSAAYAAGLVKGYEDGAFRPDSGISRQEMAILIHQALQYTGHFSVSSNNWQTLDRYADRSSIAVWAQNAVDAVTALGITQGMDTGHYEPNATATRAEAAAMIKRLLQKIEFINS